MGHTTALVRVCNPQDRARCLDLELIVDTGSTYTWIRRERLESIGVRPSGTRRFRTIEGRTVEREVGGGCHRVPEREGHQGGCVRREGRRGGHGGGGA